MIVLVGAWLIGVGYFLHGSSWEERPLILFWPIVIPIGMLYHWWRWGPKRRRRFIYINTRWWQRGDRVPRQSSWMDE